MSFSKHKNMEYPTQAHLAKEPRSFNNFSSPNRTLPTLDIEAARASERARDQKTWTASQWSDDSWDDTAVEGRSNSFDGHSRISKDGKSITGSISEFYMDGATGSSQSVSRDEKLPSTSGTPVAEAPLSLSHQIALISICCLAQFLNLAGMNQTVAPVMILSDYFDIRDYGTLSWFSAAYSMSVGTFILPAGRLGDMYGHKRIFVLGWIWFAISSFVCGFSYVSGDIVLFSIFRAFQGIGPAVLVPNAIALLARNFALGTPRNMAFAWFGAAGPTGATAGAVFTALVAQLSWWPWCFWALAGVCLIVATLSLFVIPGKPGDLFKSPPSSNNLTFDYWGCLTGVSGLILVNFALNQAPLVGWFTWYIPSLLILGAALLWTFVMIELHHTKDPLIPIRGLGRDAYFALGCIAAGWGSHGIWAYFLYLFLEQIRGYSALLTSAMTSPVAVTGIFFALSSVWLVKRLGVAWTMFIAMMNFLIGTVLLATVPLGQTYWLQIFLSVLIMPGAMNLSFPAATMLLSSALPKEKQGIAASLVSTMVNYCISCGLGVAGTIHRHVFEEAAKDHNLREEFEHHPPLSATGVALNLTRMDSFRGPWMFACALCGFGVFIAAAYIVVERSSTRRHKH